MDSGTTTQPDGASDDGTRSILEIVPGDVEATYEGILNTINKKPRPQRELARRTLIWTAYARRPLQIDELAYILAIEMDTKSQEDLEPSIPTKEIILDACSNLISVDQDRVVRFAQFSAQEFVTSHRSSTRTLDIQHDVAHREIAQLCMNFLILFPQRSDSLAVVLAGIHQYAFYQWPHHLRAGNLNSLQATDSMVTLTMSFFEKSPMLLTEQPAHFGSMGKEKSYLEFSPATLALIFDLPVLSTTRSLYEQPPRKPVYDHDLNCIVLANDKLAIHYAIAELDSVPVTRTLYDHGFSLNYSYSHQVVGGDKLPDWLQLSPLYSIRSTQMAKYLLDNDISIEPQDLDDSYADPLEYFARKGGWGTEVLQLLLDRVSGQGGRLAYALQTAIQVDSFEAILLLLDKTGKYDYVNVLEIAADEGKIALIQLLLDKGADVYAQEGYGRAFQAAAYRGRLEVIQLLLDKGVDVNSQGGRYGNALQAAVYEGKLEAIQLLLDKGADVNAQGGRYGNALQAAVTQGTSEVIQLLLDNGADVNAHGGPFGNILQFAAAVGRVNVIQLLLDKGANVNFQGGRSGNALQAAAYEGILDVTQLLLDKGAEVNAQGGKYGHALQAAALSHKVEVIQLLLDKGAEVNAQGGIFGNALQAAVYTGKSEAIQLLLDNEADVNALGGQFGNALQAAAYRGKVEVIQLLLDNGADVNAQGGQYSHPLQAAALSHKVEAIRLLLDKGADVNAQGGPFGNALQAAVSTGKLEVIQLLLDNGADVNARGGQYGNALQAAAESQGPLKVFQLLLDHGADVNAQGGKYGNALQAAAFTGKVEVVRLLLDKGADVNAQGGLFGIALQAAVHQGMAEVAQMLLCQGANINAQGGMYGTVLQAAAHRGNIQFIQMLLDLGADIHARCGKYGAHLEKMLALEPEGTDLQVPGDLPLLVELLLEHAPTLMKCALESDHEDIAARYSSYDRCRLDVFRKMLESQGWKRKKINPE